MHDRMPYSTWTFWFLAGGLTTVGLGLATVGLGALLAPSSRGEWVRLGRGRPGGVAGQRAADEAADEACVLG